MIELELVDVLALFFWSKPEEVVDRYFEFSLHSDDLLETMGSGVSTDSTEGSMGPGDSTDTSFLDDSAISK